MPEKNDTIFYKILPFIGQIIVLSIGLISFSISIRSDIVKNSAQSSSNFRILDNKTVENRESIVNLNKSMLDTINSLKKLANENYNDLKKSLRSTQVTVFELKKNTNMYIDRTNDRQRALLQMVNTDTLKLSTLIDRSSKEIAKKLNAAMVETQKQRIADQQYNASEREKLIQNHW